MRSPFNEPQLPEDNLDIILVIKVLTKLYS